MSDLVLASHSPRRRDLLGLLGHPFTCDVSTVDETSLPDEKPHAHVTRLSEMKARDVASRHEGALIIGADTVVVLDERILGKPTSPEHAVDMLMTIQGRIHTVFTGFALYNARSTDVFSSYETTLVTMRSMSRDIALRYVETNEPLDKAGSYGIQGYGAALVTSITGCYFNVMGLPLARLMDSLETFTDGEFGMFGLRRTMQQGDKQR